MKSLVTVLVICLAITSPVGHASWLKDALNKSKKTISGWMEETDQRLPELTSEEIEDYPSHYVIHRELEPLFNSPLFYLETGDKDKPAILLIHGLGEAASKDWLKVIPELEKEYRVFALDLPGFGLSKGQYFEYSPENYSQIINWFITTKIVKTPTLVGHSMGGAISLYYAAIYPKSINQLVLVDAAGILERTSYIKHLAELPAPSNDGPKVWSQLNSNIRNFSNKWVEKSGEFYDPTKLFHSNKLLRQAILAEQAGLNAALAMIDTNYSRLDFHQIPPTVIVWGKQDAIAPLRTGAALMAKIPKAKLRIIDDAGHVPMNSHPQIFNEILLKEIAVDANPATYNDDARATTLELETVIPHRKANCENDDKPNFSGEYHTIKLNNCKLAELTDVTVKNFSSKKSIVTISNSQIGNLHSIIEIDSSAITATASNFYGLIKTDRSRLDFAAVTLHAKENILRASDTTKLVFSVSDVTSINYTGPLHGYYALNENSLDQYFIDKD